MIESFPQGGAAMIRSMEEPTMLDLALEHADDDVAREYEALSEVEELAPMPQTGGEGALLEVPGELALVRDELEELAAIEDPGDFASTRMAEAETTADRVARRFEGIDVDELAALAHSDEPDDEIERSVEMMEG
jgi:hypothetical protein